MQYDSLAQDTVSLEWSIAGELPSESKQPHFGVAGAIVGWNHNKVLLAGGANFPNGLPWEGGKKVYHNTLYLFEKNGNTYQAILSAKRLTDPVAYAANCSTPFGIVAAGGENGNGLLSHVLLFTLSDSSHEVAIEQLPSLPQPTTNASAVYMGDCIFILGGDTESGTTADCWKFNLNERDKGWEQITSLPKPLSFFYTGTRTQEGRSQIFILGGRAKTANGISIFSNNVFSYSLEANTWVEETALPYPVSAGTSITLSQFGILLFGGDTGERFSRVEQKLVEIARAEDQDKPELIKQKNQLLSTHPGFSNQVVLYSFKTMKPILFDTLPFSVPVTTTAVIVDGHVLLPSGEIKAGVRTPQILMATIKNKE